MTTRGDDGRSEAPLGQALDTVERAGDETGVSVDDVLKEAGERSFALILLVPALVIISPASAIPGVPSLLASLIGLIVIQMLFGRDHLWVPKVLRRRRLSAKGHRRVLAFLRPPARRIDPFLKVRMSALARRPLSLVPLLVTLAICALMPLVEVIPLLTSVLATSITLFAVGLHARDGLIILIGYIALSCVGTLVFLVATPLAGGS